MRATGICLLAAAVLIAAGPAWGQTSSVRLTSNFVMPQARVAAVRPGQQVQVTGVKVGVVILEQAATTTMDIALHNPTGSRQEAQLLVPVPDGAEMTKRISLVLATATLTPRSEPARAASRVQP